MKKRGKPAAADLANQARSQLKRAKVDVVLGELERQGATATFPSVARMAGVSDDLVRKYFKDRVIALRDGSSATPRSKPQPDGDQHKERAANAEARVAELENEVHSQREQIGRYLGQLRDLEHAVEGAGDLRRLQDDKDVAVASYNAAQKRVADLELQLKMSRQQVASLNERAAELEAQILELRKA